MKQRNLLSLAVITLCITIALATNGYSYVNHNGAGGGYGEGGDEGASVQTAGNTGIEFYIMKGGGYYMEANANIQSLLKLVELKDIQGVNYLEMLIVTDRALFYMKQAKDTYETLIQKAETTPYNEAVLEKLSVFDYTGFSQENGLNKEIFNIVRDHLQNGDITGMFTRTYNDFVTIIQLLNEIKWSVFQYRLPALSIFWKLNEIQASSSLFGSYVARLFSDRFNN